MTGRSSDPSGICADRPDWIVFQCCQTTIAPAIVQIQTKAKLNRAEMISMGMTELLR